MRSTTSTAAFLAMVSRVLAQTDGFDAMTKPTKGEVINAGSTYQIIWDYNAQYAGTVSITLLEGATPQTLELGETFASGIDNSAGSYSWAVDSSLGDDATYGLKISLDSNSTIFQYSFPFSIAASSEGSSSSGAVISTTSTSVASSTSVSPTSSTSTYSRLSSSASNTEATSSETSASETSVSETSASETASIEMSSPTATSTSGSKSAASTGVTKTTLTSVNSASSTGSATTSSSSPIVTAGAGKVVAGTFAAMAGLVAVLLAL